MGEYYDTRDDPKHPLDVDDLCEKNERLQRRICALGRKYDAMYKELEEAREALGYYASPLPFLKFPREIRDKIYTYALQAPLTVRTHPISLHFKSISIYKPPTPCMLLVNRQIYHEAKEIIYSRNTFTFFEPARMTEFVEQIGNENKDRIQSITIDVDRTYRPPDADPNLKSGSEPRFWAWVLKQIDFKNIVKMHLLGEDIKGMSWTSVTMDPIMEKTIKHVLQRNPANKAKRKLVLTGYNGLAYKKFPKKWDIIQKNWPPD